MIVWSTLSRAVKPSSNKDRLNSAGQRVFIVTGGIKGVTKTPWKRKSACIVRNTESRVAFGTQVIQLMQR